MKKYVVMLVAAMLAVSLAACSTQNPSSADSSSTPVSDSSSGTESTASLAEETKGSYTGVIADATMNSITVSGSDGRELTFSTGEGSEVNQFEGLEIGQTVTVEYVGSVENDDASGVTVTTITVDTNAEQGPGEGQSGGIISGTVVEASMNSVSIVNDNGQQIDFSLNDGTQIDLADGIVENQRITVEYVGQLNGTDASSVTVTRVSAAE